MRSVHLPWARLLRVEVVATLFMTGSPLAVAQQGDDPPPAVDRQVGSPPRRSDGTTRRSVRAPSRDEERAAALARGRQRFFNQVDEFGTDKGPVTPGPGVFPIGRDGMPTVNTVPKFRRR